MMLLFGAIKKYQMYEDIFDRLRRRKVTVAQMHLLLMLASKGVGEEVNMEELRLHMSKKHNRHVAHSTISRAIANLSSGKNRYGQEGHGFVDKFEGEDSRFQIIILNKRGLEVIEKTFNI